MTSLSDGTILQCRANTVPDESEHIYIVQTMVSLRYHFRDSPGDVRQRMAILSSLLAPIRRLPREILSLIFLQPSLQPQLKSIDQHRRIHGRQASVLLGQGAEPFLSMCFHWREVAVSTPQLWCFAISLSGNDSVAQLVELYLEQSTGCPLTLVVRGGEQVNLRILRALLNTCECWFSLYLETQPGNYPLFLPARNRVSSLEELGFDDSTWSGKWMVTGESEEIFCMAPQLYRLAVWRHRSPLLKLPLTQITSLDVSPKFLSLAAMCPQLQTLSCNSLGGLVPGVPVLLLNLSTLYAPPVLLRALTTPKLISLDLCMNGEADRDDPWQWSEPDFLSFVQRSGCSISTLCLENIYMRGSDLLSVFALVPRLESLRLVSLRPHSITNRVLEALVLGPDLPVTIPMLRRLVISGSYLFSNAALLNFFESRGRGAMPCLQQVELNLQHQEMKVEEVARLKALKVQW
ncbi:hypothetical protein C8R43DRAFT_1124757 [Mycena crocata]|nr:hypothetical protein C8R43DRAFT_1124757 [Mycena crocata]